MDIQKMVAEVAAGADPDKLVESIDEVADQSFLQVKNVMISTASDGHKVISIYGAVNYPRLRDVVKKLFPQASLSEH